MTLAITPAHTTLLAGLSTSAAAPRVVVIGATALNHHVPLLRMTADVDFVIVAEFEDINARLQTLGWQRDEKAAQRWRDDALNIVDVLPATPAIVAAGFVDLAGRRLNTLGFDIALANASPVALVDSDSTVDVASLASVVVLKMVAWLDRPERERDLSDIGRAFHAALDEFDDPRRWEPPLADVPHEEQVAFFIGEQVKKEIGPSHRVEIRKFLRKIAEGRLEGLIGAGGLAGCRDVEEVARRRLAAFERALG